ncbi:MAG: dynamin family protein [Deltaproteobacteria bacterium]|nr:dynamin family protein [Deltaproteobacteria bacterium]
MSLKSYEAVVGKLAASGHASSEQPLNMVALRNHTLSLLIQLQAHFQAHGSVCEGLDELQRNVTEEYYRVAVLGGFNRGKSSLINALLDVEDLLPIAALPSTSGLIAVRYGHQTTYERLESSGILRRESRDTFRAHNSRAAASSHAVDVKSVPSWRVHTPSGYLRDHQVELVDTPGISEDFVRARLAMDEARSADAAIVVLDPEYIGDERELELLRSLESSAEQTFVVLNKAEKFSADERSNIKSFLLQRLREIGFDLPERNVFYASSLYARGPRRETEWVTELERLREHLRENLLTNSRPKKALALARRLRRFVALQRDGQAAAAKALMDWQGELKRNDVAAEVRALRKTIAQAQSTLRTLQLPIFEFISAFERWVSADLRQKIRVHQESYWIDVHPASDPIRVTTIVAERAGRTASQALVDWLKTCGEQILTRSIDSLLDSVKTEMDQVATFAQRKRPLQSVGSLQTELRSLILLEAQKEIDRLKQEIVSRWSSVAFLRAEQIRNIAAQINPQYRNTTSGRQIAEQFIIREVIEALTVNLLSLGALNSIEELAKSFAVLTDQLAEGFGSVATKELPRPADRPFQQDEGIELLLQKRLEIMGRRAADTTDILNGLLAIASQLDQLK